MKILVCPDSFKESLSAARVAAALKEGFSRAPDEILCDLAPIADGGEGTVDAMLAEGGRKVPCRVTGPLGSQVDAALGIMPDGRTAVIEMAAAAGLHLVPPDRRDPAQTTTYGVGELILRAVGEGARRIIVGLGGSATNDGGAGMARAMGVRFLDERGQELPAGVPALKDLAHIDVSAMPDPLKDVAVEAACDVDNPLAGARGASAVYGPQKGATRDQVGVLDAALGQLADVIHRDMGLDVAGLPGAGAAGGLAAGLVAFLGAKLRPGFAMIAEAARLRERAAQAGCIVTGEGRVDSSTLNGKAVSGVLEIAQSAGKPCIVVCGSLGEGSGLLYDRGATALFALAEGPMTQAESVAGAERLLQSLACNLGRLLIAAGRIQ